MFILQNVNGLLPRFINTSAPSLPPNLHSSETNPLATSTTIVTSPNRYSNLEHLHGDRIYLTSLPSIIADSVQSSSCSLRIVVEQTLPRPTRYTHQTLRYPTECLLNTTARQNHNTLPAQDHPQTALCPKFQSNEAGPPLVVSSWIV